jgi:hypothetical protein
MIKAVVAKPPAVKIAAGKAAAAHMAHAMAAKAATGMATDAATAHAAAAEAATAMTAAAAAHAAAAAAKAAAATAASSAATSKCVAGDTGAADGQSGDQHQSLMQSELLHQDHLSVGLSARHPPHVHANTGFSGCRERSVWQLSRSCCRSSGVAERGEA